MVQSTQDIDTFIKELAQKLQLLSLSDRLKVVQIINDLIQLKLDEKDPNP